MTDMIGPPKPKTLGRGRRLRWYSVLWMLLVMVVLCLGLMLATMSLTGQVLTLPEAMTDRLSQRVNARLSGVGIDLGRIELGVSDKGRPQLRLVNVGIRDQTGLEVAQLNAIQGGVKLWPLLQGRVEPSGIALSGAQVTVRRMSDGTLDLSFGQAAGASGNLSDILDAVDGVFRDGVLSAAELIEADQLTITLEDARSGRIWQATDGKLKLTQTEKLVDITVSFDVFNQTEDLAATVLGFRLDKRSSEASLGASFTNARAADIAAQSPALAFLSVVDAPISGALRAVVDANGQTSDLAGTLSFGAGALSPTPGIRPVRFEGARVYMDFDPDLQRVNFTELSVTSDWGTMRVEGVSYLSDWVRGWPTTLISQHRILEADLNPQDWFADPVHISRGAFETRLRLDPFTLDIGQLVLEHAANTYTAKGGVHADSSGWSVALDAHADQLSRDEALELWPPAVAAMTRDWVMRNTEGGALQDADMALRIVPGEERRLSLGSQFQGITLRPVPKMSPIHDTAGYLSIEGHRMALVAEQGALRSPSGDALSVAGTSFTIPDIRQKGAMSTVQLAVAGPLQGVLSVLDAPPFQVFRAAPNLGPDIATGQVVAEGVLRIPMKAKVAFQDVTFDIAARISQLRSDRLVPGKLLTAPRAQVQATHERIEVSADGKLAGAPGSGRWSMSLRPEDKGTGSRVEGRIALSQAALDAFNIGLPSGMVSGQGVGEYRLDLPPGAPMRFRLTSDLNRLRLSVPAVGWSKPANRTGRLLVEGQLGAAPGVERLELEAPGLSARGRVELGAGGTFRAAIFDQVNVGGWLKAPVSFTARGPGQAVAISVNGGSLDMRRASFGNGAGGAGGTGGARGARGAVATRDTPLSLRLDRLTVSEGIVLTGFAGKLNLKGGVQGTFTARVQGGAPIRGTVAPQPAGTAVRISSSDAGAVLRGAGLFQNARGGDLTLTLAPRPGKGVYEGAVKVRRVRVKDAPAMAELLSAVSVIGLLEQLDGEGLVFSEVDARFRLEPRQVTLYSSSAVGPSLGISLDGFYDLTNSTMNMQGVISPLYALNMIGRIFSRKGEGLVGFTFRLRGTPDDPKVKVNLLSLFTPVMFREIFRRSPPPRPEGK